MAESSDVTLWKPPGEFPLAEEALPPIGSVVIPKVQTASTRIRWLKALGYATSTISNHLGIRYQMVRNVSVTIPKRAAREDLPKLEVWLHAEADFVEAGMDGALDASLLAARKERKAQEKAQRRQDREIREGELQELEEDDE